MKPTGTITRSLLPALAVSACLAGGVSTAQAASHGGGHEGHGGGQQHSEHGGMGKGMGMRHGGKGMHGDHGGGMRHGGKGMHGGHGGGKHQGPHLYGPDWKDTLTDAQKTQLDKLHRDYARTKAPLKAGIKARKVELAVLATASEPNPQSIEAKIDELLALKRDAMRAKYAYVAAQRQVLSDEQRVSFDMHKIHKAMHGKKGGGRGGH